MELPAESQVITKALLKEVIKSGLKCQMVEIDNFNVESKRSPGENILSVVLHISVDARIDDEDVKHHLVSKLVFVEEQLRSKVTKARRFEKETHAYEVFLPAMFAKTNNLRINIPKFYKGITKNSQRSSEVGVFIEDITSSDFKTCGSNTLLDLEQCYLSMGAAAKFHALSLRLLMDGTLDAMPEKELVYLETLYANTPDQPYGRFYQFAVKSCYRLFDKIVTDVNLRGKAAKHMQWNTEDYFQSTVKPDDLFNVICHGDLKQTNFLFRYDKLQRPIDVALIDFQTHRVANPAMDLMYFFFHNTSSELRQKHFKALLNVYHETFLQCLVEMKLPLDSYTFDDLRNSVKKYAIFGGWAGLYLLVAFSPNTREFVDFNKDFTQEDIQKCSEAIFKSGDGEQIVGIISDIIAIHEDQLF